MTKFLVSSLVLVLVLALSLSAECRRKRQLDDTLELVHVIFRHGDRTPDRSVMYKNDPYINETYYPFGQGQLTNTGKKKEYQIGEALRKKYQHFLGDFTLDSVDSRCTDYNRTKMSLQLVLASLFPPRGKNVWKEKLDWQPVPFNYWPEAEDHILGYPHHNCPAFIKAYMGYLNSTEGIAQYEKYKNVTEYLEEKTGQALYSKSFSELYLTLTTEHEYGFDMPDWAKPVYRAIEHLAIMEYNTSTASDLQKRLTSGFLVKKIIDDSIAKAEGRKYRDTKIFLYSAHESNIAFLLRFLGLFHSHVPPYGSYISIEVHNFNGVRSIKLYYQDYSYARPRRMRIPKCGSFCNLKKFEMIYHHLIPQSEKECFEEKKI